MNYYSTNHPDNLFCPVCKTEQVFVLEQPQQSLWRRLFIQNTTSEGESMRCPNCGYSPTVEFFNWLKMAGRSFTQGHVCNIKKLLEYQTPDEVVATYCSIFIPGQVAKGLVGLAIMSFFDNDSMACH